MTVISAAHDGSAGIAMAAATSLFRIHPLRSFVSTARDTARSRLKSEVQSTMTDAEILSMLYDIRSATDVQDLDAIYDRIEPVITELEKKEVPT